MAQSITYDLREVPVYCLTLRKNKERKEHVQYLRDKYGFNQTKFHFVYGIDAADQEGMSVQTAGAMGLAKIAEDTLSNKIFQPFLFLEDDVNILLKDRNLELTVPASCDAVYVGISACAVQPDQNV